MSVQPLALLPTLSNKELSLVTYNLYNIVHVYVYGNLLF